MIDELFKTVFLNENCIVDLIVKRTFVIFMKKKTKWIWKNEKKNYQKFLNCFQSDQATEMINHDTFDEKNVFQIFSVEMNSFSQNSSQNQNQNQNHSISSWNAAYKKSDWFEITYRILIDMNSECFLNARKFFKIMNYRIDSKNVFWKNHNLIYLFCISERKVLFTLKTVHDNDEHWTKQSILTKFRELIYWFTMSVDVKRYIQKCIQCIFHESVQKFQFLHSIRVKKSFQLIDFDFIESFSVIKRECCHVFHVMNYLFRFFIIFFTMTANVENVISVLKKKFILYIKLESIYCDRKQHFENFKIKFFFSELNISITFNFSKFHQNTDMIEIENRFLKNIFRKFRFNNQNWKKILFKFICNFNVRIIFHLKSFSFIILLKIASESFLIDFILRYVDFVFIMTWAIQMKNSNEHKKAVRKFIFFKNQFHDVIKTRFDQKKNMKAFYFNKKILQYIFSSENMIVLYQKKSEKLKSRWKIFFMILKSEERGVSYRLHQLNEKKIKKTFHDNHLKLFRSRKGYLIDSFVIFIFAYQIIRKSRIRKIKF